MSHTTILVHTSASSAVLHSCQHGWSRIQVDTSQLPAAERELLAASVYAEDGARYGERDRAPYDVAPPTEDGLRASLRARLAEIAAKAGEEEAERQRTAAQAAEDVAAVQALLAEIKAKPAEELVNGTELATFSVYPVTDYSAPRAQAALSALGIPVIRSQPIVTAEHVGRSEEVAPLIAAAEQAAQAARAENERKRAERDAVAKQAQAEYEAEKTAWIPEYGSERLRLGIAAGYEMDDLYRAERHTHDWPGWHTDEADALGCDNATSSTPSQPSLEALRAAALMPDATLLLVQKYRHDPNDEAADRDGDLKDGTGYVLRIDHLGDDLFRDVAEIVAAAEQSSAEEATD